jgi:hypothetical protein
MFMRDSLAHGDIIQPDRVDELMDFLAPFIHMLLTQLEPGEFTTPMFIEFMRSIPEGEELYQEALRRWGEADEHMSKMVIHGQVIPGILRRSPTVEWAGFAHGEPDPFGVPAWWRLRES